MFAFLIEARWHPRVVELLLFKSTILNIRFMFFQFAKREKQNDQKVVQPAKTC